MDGHAVSVWGADAVLGARIFCAHTRARARTHKNGRARTRTRVRTVAHAVSV